MMRAAPSSARAGHSLLEMMIATALGLVLVVAAASAYRAQRAASAHSTDLERMEEAGMNALRLVGDDLQMAGFVSAEAPQALSSAPLLGCTGGRPVGTVGKTTCETLGNRSDGIEIRYVGDDVSTWLSASGEITDCLGQASASPIVNRYYAKTSTSTREPELYCQGSGHVTPQPLVEGVEKLRLRYWLPGAALAVEASALRPDQWGAVVAVDLCVLVRGEVSGERPRYIDCEGASVTATDARSRRTFWRHVALRNVRYAR